jgi:hypothetical protein
VSGILGLWNAIVQTIGVLAIVCIGLGLMVGAVEPTRAFVRIGGVLGCMVLLLGLPPILVGIWQSLSFWQHTGIILLVGIVSVVVLHGAGLWSQRRSHSHQKGR